MDLKTKETIASVTILSLLMATSLVGNILIIIATCSTAKLRTFTNLLVCNLALSDLLITCINLPIRICHYFGVDWAVDGTSECKLSVTITVFVFTSSNMNLFLITLNRFMGVTFPLRYRGMMTNKKLIFAVLFSWTYSLIVATFPFIIVGDKIVDESDRIVVCTFPVVLSSAYVMFIEFGTFFVPWLLMSAMYVVILYKLYISRNSRIRSKTQLSNMTSNECGLKVSRRTTIIRTISREVKLAKGVYIIMSTYTILLMPIATIDVIDTINRQPIVPLIAIKVCLILAYATPAVNPLIYALSSRKYRKAFVRLWYYSDAVIYNRIYFKERRKQNSTEKLL